jgi:uncharacterized protein YggE
MRGKKLLAGFLLVVVIITLVTGCTGLSPPSASVSPSISGSLMFSQQNTGIWVTGEGKVSVVPDVAILSLGVEAQTDTVAEAQNQAATAMAAVVTELDRYDIAEKDIKTQRFSIIPIRRWVEEKGEEILIGYRVTNTVTVKVREVDNIGTIIDAVVKAGGDFIRIHSISFTVDDPSAYHTEAREMAMADAEAKGKHLAELGDVKLGKPIFINESGGFIPVVREVFIEAPVPAPMMAPPPTSISPGETEIRLSVQVVYNIE